MGNLFDFNIFDLQDDFELECMVETGTYKGQALEYGSICYKDLYSVDINEEFYKKNLEKFKNNSKVHLFHGKSTDRLEEILGHVGNRKTLFWLDAHSQNRYLKEKVEETVDVELPVLDELKIIARCKDISRDIFIIDDMTDLYGVQKIDKETGNVFINGERNIEIMKGINEILCKTHKMIVLFFKDGYLFATPPSKYDKKYHINP